MFKEIDPMANRIRMHYTKSFVLARPNLSRMLDIIESKYAEIQLAARFEYKIVLSKGKIVLIYINY